MFLFLPDTYKQHVKKEYRLRLWASACFMLACIFLISSALVFPAYISAENAHAIASADYAAAVKAESAAGDTDVESMLAKTKTYMTALAALSPLDADAIVKAITSVKPSGVSITSISAAKVLGGIAISVGGNVGTRNELVAFSNALQNASNFSSVTFPVSDLAQDTNIAYTISLSIKTHAQ